MLVFEIDDGIVVADGRLQQTLGVVGRGRLYDLQPRHMREPRLRILGVVRAAAKSTAGRAAKDDGHRRAPSIARFRRVVHDLIERAHDEVGELEFDDRTQPFDRRGAGGADEAALRNRRIDDALGSEFVEKAARDLERSAEHRDVLAEQDDVAVAAHLVPQGL